ncbi:MAG: LuxR family transcriptional regulator [Phenylobacterium sp.]|nr:MAG: LuxR family transcriptional regulator [Phenylobacterium sp.]
MGQGGAPTGNRLDQLTPKERECLRLVGENRSSKQIARQLGISQTSVDTHLRRARHKLGIRDRYAAARLLEAQESGGAAAAAGPTVAVGPGVGFSIPPLSSLNIVQRLGLIVAGAIAAALLFGLLLSAMAAL